jgi:hypothetical protein
MGSIITRHRNVVDELETIVQNLDKLHSRSFQLQQSRYNFFWWVTVIALFGSSVYSGVLCVQDTQHRYLYVFFTWVFAAVLLWTVRFLMTHFFEFIMHRNENRIATLNQRRSKIIEEVKETEKFKVAKQIIEKYGAPEDLIEIGVLDKKQEKVPQKGKLVIRLQFNLFRQAARTAQPE